MRLLLANTERISAILILLAGSKLTFVSGSGHDLMKPPFLSMDLTTSDGGTGHVGFVFHKQPELERAIRDVLAQSSFSELRTQATVTSIVENEKSVTAEYIDQGGCRRRLRAPFLVGADGKTGYVRKKYMEPKGVVLERCEG